MTWNVRPTVYVQERLELPEPATIAGEAVQAVLFVVRLIIPAKPFRPFIEIVELPEDPANTVIVAGLAEIVKSWTT